MLVGQSLARYTDRQKPASFGERFGHRVEETVVILGGSKDAARGVKEANR